MKRHRAKNHEACLPTHTFFLFFSGPKNHTSGVPHSDSFQAASSVKTICSHWHGETRQPRFCHPADVGRSAGLQGCLQQCLFSYIIPKILNIVDFSWATNGASWLIFQVSYNTNIILTIYASFFFSIIDSIEKPCSIISSSFFFHLSAKTLFCLTFDMVRNANKKSLWGRSQHLETDWLSRLKEFKYMS